MERRHSRFDRRNLAAIRALGAEVKALREDFNARQGLCDNHGDRLSKLETRIYAGVVLLAVLGPPILKHILNA